MTTRKSKRITQDNIYWASVHRGDDPSYARWLAERWQKRKERQKKARKK